MSSRAAGGRKRLQEPKPRPATEAKPLRSFFSRSKSTAPKAKPQLQLEISPPIPQHTATANHEHRFASPDIVLSRSEAPQDVRYLAHPHRSRSPQLKNPQYVPYPSPEPPSRTFSPFLPALDHSTPQRLKKAASSSDMLSMSHSPSPYGSQFPECPSQMFLEATYQPPPPPRWVSSRPLSPPDSPYLPPNRKQQIHSRPNPDIPTSAHFNAFNSLLLQPTPSTTPELPRYSAVSPQGPLEVVTNVIPPQRETRNQPIYHSGIYPSPPTSHSPLLLRSEYPPLNTEPQSSPSSPEESHSDYSGNSHVAPSIISSSSSSSPRSGGFVFPGSRSTGRPKAPNGTPRIKFTKRSESTAPNQEALASPNPPAIPVPDIPPSQLHPSPQPSPASSGAGSSSPRLSRPRKGSTATNATSETSKTSSSSSSKHSNPGFVYPAGRSRAQPNVKPINLSSFKSKSSKHSKKSSGSTVSDGPGRTRFMGIGLKKKKSRQSDSNDTRADTPESPLAFTLAMTADGSSMCDYDDASQIGSTTSHGGPAGPEFEAYKQQQMAPEVRRHERMARIKSRIGNYPLDPYDSVLLDNDRHTGDLLNRLNGTGSPTFHDYGNHPPVTVLDLGCGQGHWVVDAAIAWKGHGTKVTGYDMVDISKVLMPWASKQGVAENIRFVRGNFLKQQLPFNDDSFDLVRMSSMALCITVDAWVFVFQEVCRVLTIGGRLEFIDDRIIFPYGKPLSSSTNGIATPSTPQLNMIAPRLDIHIPSSAFSTFSVYGDSDRRNPGLGNMLEEEDEDEFYDLYQVKEEGESDLDDTATFGGVEGRFGQDPRSTPVPRNSSRVTQRSARWRTWNTHAATSRDLEALFEHMLTHKFGVHIYPDEFVLDLMQEVFGHAREVRKMHLSLAPPDAGAVDEDAPRGRMPNAQSRRSHDQYGSFGNNFKYPSPSPARTIKSVRSVGTPLSLSPGLILSPSTFIPMTQSELEIHSSKHLRILLSCKKFLVEHAMEATEDEEIDEDSVLEALWEYEGFLRARFNHPPEIRERDKSPASSDAASTRGSITSVSSDGQDAMWEYQSELRQRFVWPNDGTESPRASKSRITPKAATVPLPSNEFARDSSPAPSIAPPYSRTEMTHVRTFRVYEAIKLDETTMSMGSACRNQYALVTDYGVNSSSY